MKMKLEFSTTPFEVDGVRKMGLWVMAYDGTNYVGSHCTSHPATEADVFSAASEIAGVFLSMRRMLINLGHEVEADPIFDDGSSLKIMDRVRKDFAA